MFIAYTQTGQTYKEDTGKNNKPFSWNDIPEDVNITALALTHQSLNINNKRISPKVSINKYHYYYYYNEAIMSVIQTGDGQIRHGDPSLVAKIMAGIDVERGYVIEIRLDKYGNTSINTHSLEVIMDKFNNGLMRKSILKTGVSCRPEKKLL